ncbi:MAG: RNA polymerase sigma-70 factor [Bacteroidetes bacterium]|jgi:RNA polymerase sigma-70 factor (ECF subfamily)|nr:RNA polymerase sigma-70 factor [Bacteroidota bacterium]
MSQHLDKQKEEKLLTSIKNDEQAFRIIYDRYWSKLFHYALNVLEDKTVCEDIVQEVFVSLWQSSDSLKIDNLSAYLFQSVKFQIFKYLRNYKIARRHLERIALLQSHNDTEDQLIAKELETELNRVIDCLPERCRQIFLLSRIEHRSNQEISLQLGLSIQTVKNQISKALAYLREEIPPDASLVLLLFLFH